MNRRNSARDTPSMPVFSSSGAGYRARDGSHDDGPLTGMFLGGIGAPACSRDLAGKFARWHLQPGYHVSQILDEACLLFRWADSSGSESFRLDDSFGGMREVSSLFPVVRERYRKQNMPLEIQAEFFTPIIPHEYEASALPVWYCTVSVTSTASRPLEADAALFWPNLLGWDVQRLSSADRPKHSWPGQTHSGNTASAVQEGMLTGALQQRHPGRPVTGGMEGEIFVCSFGSADQRSSVEACFKAGTTRIGRPDHLQKYTLPWAQQYFRDHGVLPESGCSWRAHWDEALGSAVSRGTVLAPGETAELRFAVIMDIPVVAFGSGRAWYRFYTEQFGASGTNAVPIARHVSGKAEAYRRMTADWHRQAEAENASLGGNLTSSMINELYVLNAGGAAWVSRERTRTELEAVPPRLGSGEHFALLEGFDPGYYYYNTLDLWSYAWYGVSRWWPRLADSVFSDYLQTIPMEIQEKRMIYRSETMEPMLVRGKLPHDLGAPMEDPWHEINSYQLRDDANTWKDHNQGFILSLYLHCLLTGKQLDADQWSSLKEAVRFMLDQDGDGDGLPLHDTFGDSTWDNLGIEGISSYSGALNLAALAAAVRWAEQFGDVQLAHTCAERLRQGQQVFTSRLYTGEYFRLCDRGKYRDCIMADSLIGIFYADLAGVGDLLQAIDRTQVVSHLRAVYANNFRKFQEGSLGPLLVASPKQISFSGDGGDELQVNEVLVGSAWMSAAMMRYYGLEDEAAETAEAVASVIYGKGKLQFRTPAAYDAANRFRAPMNMRPLAVWLLAAAGETGIMQQFNDKG